VADATGTTVWRWDQAEPFGNNPADEDPDANSVAFDLPLRLPGQRYDAESGLHYNYFRDYDPSLGRYGESDPIGLRGGSNTYAYVLGRPLRDVDVFGLSVWICNREVQGFPGTGNHAYVWNDKTGKACSMRGSSGFGLPSERELGPTRPGVKGDSCVEVPGSPGKEDDIMNCCRASANSGVWFPWVNDCHNAADKCIRKSGLKNPGAPGGRTGECDSCQPRQYPDLYGTP
jgi:RHS repeat-associated protein